MTWCGALLCRAGAQAHGDNPRSRDEVLPGYLGTSDATLLQCVVNGKSGRSRKSGSPAQFGLGSSASFRCPNCNSTNLRVSIAYQQGLFHIATRTRLRAALVGGRGPDFLVGSATTRGVQQSALAKRLRPPVKWSYGKLTFWWTPVFLSIGWIVFYINTITGNSGAALSPPLAFFCLPLRSYCCCFCSGDTISAPTNVGIHSGNARSSASAAAL